jgi:hypothetical protein
LSVQRLWPSVVADNGNEKLKDHVAVTVSAPDWQVAA